MKKLILLVVAAVLALPAFLFAQTTTSTTTTVGGSIQVHGGSLMQILGIPPARDMVTIPEGAPFIVPAGRKFVLTGMGTRNGIQDGTLVIMIADGFARAVSKGSVLTSDHVRLGVMSVPIGCAIEEGIQIEASGGGGLSAVLWGYLEDV